MIIDFKNLEQTVIPNFYGGEKECRAKMYANDFNRVLVGSLEPGASIGYHEHSTSSEIIYILQGEGKVLIEGEYESVKAGECHYCKKGQSHSLINSGEGELVFFAVVPQQ